MIKNRVIYLTMVVLSVVNLLISENRGAYILLYALVIFALISLFIVLLSYFSFDISQELSSSSIVKGESVRYILNFSNKFAPFCGFRVRFKPVSEAISFELEDIKAELPAGGKYTAETEILSKYRGLCNIGVDYVEFNDLLGIFQFRKRLKSDLTLMICPRIVPVNTEIALNISTEQSGSNYKFRHDDNDEINDIRKYVSSDSIKRIHWKLSAKKNEWLVKNYSVSHTSVTAVVADNRKMPENFKDSIAFEDRVVETAVSLTNYFLNLNQPVILEYLTPEGTENLYENSAFGFEKIYADCASMEFVSKDVKELFSVFYSEMNSITSLYIISFCLDDDVFSFLNEAVLIGYDVSFIHFYKAQDDNLALKFANSGVKYYGFEADKDFNEDKLFKENEQRSIG